MRADDASTTELESLARLFEKQVARGEGRIALICDRNRVTYGELNRRANQFARLLRSRGAQRGDLIAVTLDRSITTFVVLLGILKAGCAYVPLDPTLPPLRRIEIATDSRAQMLVVTHDDFCLHDFEGRVIAVSQIQRDLAIENEDDLDVPSVATDVCCVLYTSGTTGKPKGVLVPGSAILNHASWMWRAHPFRDSDVALIHRSYMHIAATWDYFGPLLGGVPTLIVPGHQTSDPAVLMRLSVENGVSHVSGSPSFWRAVLDRPKAQLEAWHTLRLGTTSGEQLSVRIASEWRSAFPRARLLNVYGLTEAVRLAVYDTSGIAEDETRVPIGFPLPNVSLYIVDEHFARVDEGDVGEICVSGACLARGYLNRVPLTRERFLAHRFGGADVVFRTGDCGRHRPDGSFEVVGRSDHQVQIRGFRVELEDVETTLDQCPAARRAAVAVREDADGEKRLIAYVVPPAGADPNWRELRAFLSARLPEHMIPSSFVILDEIPLTPSGKIDRQALNTLDPPAAPRGCGASEASRTATEEALVAIWSRLLGMSEVSVDDTFLELGGHSVTAMQIASRVSDRFGVELPLESFFSNPTLRAMSAAIDALRESDPAARLASGDRQP